MKQYVDERREIAEGNKSLKKKKKEKNNEKKKESWKRLGELNEEFKDIKESKKKSKKMFQTVLQ